MLELKHGQFKFKDRSVAEEKGNGKKRMGWEFREIKRTFEYPKRAKKESSDKRTKKAEQRVN